MDFLPSSLVLQKKLGMKKRAKQGIFFTPKTLRDILFSHIENFEPTTILEPSCGSGEFLVDCRNKYPDASLVGVELEPQLVIAAQSIVPDAIVYNENFLTWDMNRKFDFIIGNPPFVQTKSVFSGASVGRSNLYIEFLFKCLTYHLNDDGILAMIIPSTIMNGCFSKPTRDLILSKQIMFFDTIRNHTFKDTSAGVSILVMKNISSENPRFNFDGILTNQAEQLRLISSGCRKIRELDLRLQYGMMTVTLKDCFSKDPNDVPFILQGDMKHDEISFGDNRLYIKNKKNTNSGRCLLLARSGGVVMGSEYDLKFAYFEAPSFLFDSALIAVFGKDIDILYKSLGDPRTKTYIHGICGSGRLTKDIILNMPIFE